jgi:hypothetical protein
MNNDQVDFLLEKEKVGIGHPPKWIIQRLSWMDGYFSCEQITESSQIASFSDQHIVWYTINEEGKSGWCLPNSFNYTISQFLQDLPKLMTKSNHQNEIVGYMKRKSEFQNGLTKDLNIRIAHDTVLNQSIIIDGTKRALVLYSFYKEEPQKLKTILESNFKINIIRIKSKFAHMMFPCDFAKFYESHV